MWPLSIQMRGKLKSFLSVSPKTNSLSSVCIRHLKLVSITMVDVHTRSGPRRIRMKTLKNLQRKEYCAVALTIVAVLGEKMCIKATSMGKDLGHGKLNTIRIGCFLWFEKMVKGVLNTTPQDVAW